MPSVTYDPSGPLGKIELISVYPQVQPLFLGLKIHILHHNSMDRFYPLFFWFVASASHSFAVLCGAARPIALMSVIYNF